MFNFSNLENYVELLNDTQTVQVELYELTETDGIDWDELDYEVESSDWLDRMEPVELEVEPEFGGIDWLVSQDLSDAEFDQLMDNC